ncbi:MAG: hypothetical protein K6F44_08490 [Lachnospiraceae bacterium]|nr:hypothetical protein [Lachnospiraceae bacterium]
MEKYKFIVKLGQIKDLIAKGQDEKAIELAETVDFKKVKNIEDLGNIAALFLKNGMLLKARECYLELYDRVANRNTVMQLINLALRLKRPNEAEKYLREYLKIDRNDFYGLIFRYNIDKLEGKPYKELIPTLEKLKKKEYIEAWAYELAKLYHKSGDVEKCIAECDDLIVFFGEGEYVERAKALKDYYEKNGAREVREKEKAEKEAEERARKEEIAEENVRVVEEAFAKHEAGDPDLTEFKAEVTPDEGKAETEHKTGTEIKTEVKPDEGKTKTERKPDKDDLLLMQLLREEGIEQPDEPIIEMDMELEDDEPEDVTGAEEQATVTQEVVGEEQATVTQEVVGEEQVTEDEAVAGEAAQDEEPAAEEVTAEEEASQAEDAGVDGEATEDLVAEDEEETEADIKPEDANTEETVVKETEEPKEETLTFTFTTEDLAQIPAKSRLGAFLEKNGSKLDDYFGYMAYINDIRVQIIKALELILNPQVMNAGIAVMGGDRNDMIAMIKGITLVESKSGLIADAMCPLASASKINRMDLENKASGLLGRCLLIESAGMLDSSSVERIMRMSEKYGRKLGFILVDSRAALMTLLRNHRDLNSILPVRIHIPVVEEKDVLNMVRYTIMKGGYSTTATCEKEIVSRVKAIKASPANRYSEAAKFIRTVIEATDKRTTEEYLAATADGRRITGENRIELRDIESVS